ncbi:hypothetical protein KHC28_11370 [Ancylobacter sonchi]|uniref:hypothetical protein n=1 Tax=Ancylobacter sonchi TaxID=1937790 RepID=UPI001BD30B09|nr:hypothetical protein [Ancylobacter sonchi]MBS7534258.1 hypothetical protein [Ancylobacter sonchi]
MRGTAIQRRQGSATDLVCDVHGERSDVLAAVAGRPSPQPAVRAAADLYVKYAQAAGIDIDDGERARSRRSAAGRNYVHGGVP